MKNIYKTIASYLAHNGGDIKNIDLYRYGIECLSCKLFPTILIIIICIIRNAVLPGIIWCTSFLSLRKTLGGAHANTQLKCTIISVLTAYLGINIVPGILLNYKYSIYVVIISITVILIIIIEKSAYSFTILFTFSANALLYFIFFFIDEYYSNLIASSVLISGISLLIKRINDSKQNRIW